jgi:hypothetical protein
MDEKQTGGIYSEKCRSADDSRCDDATPTRFVEREMRHGPDRSKHAHAYPGL